MQNGLNKQNFLRFFVGMVIFIYLIATDYVEWRTMYERNIDNCFYAIERKFIYSCQIRKPFSVRDFPLDFLIDTIKKSARRLLTPGMLQTLM